MAFDLFLEDEISFKDIGMESTQANLCEITCALLLPLFSILGNQTSLLIAGSSKVSNRWKSH